MTWTLGQGVIGWSATSVPDATAALYRGELRRLDGALVAFRRAGARRPGEQQQRVAAR